MRRALLPVLLVFLAAGCAKVEPQADFAKMAAVVAEREGVQPLWRRTPEDDAAVAGQAAAVAARGMTLADAVRLALVNNPGVQARFEDIGVARSEVVQAGLPQNPSLAVLFGFPLFAGGPLGSFAATAMTSVSDLAQVKDRTAKAQAELERDILLVGLKACETAREARLAWLEVAYAKRALTLGGEVAGQVKKLSEAAKYYRSFGLADDARVAALEAGTAKAGLETAELRARLQVAKARLARLTGLDPAQPYDIAGEVPAKAVPLPQSGETSAFAQAHNLAVQAAIFAEKAAQSGVALENIRWLRDFDIGLGYDLDIESNRTVGPGASVRLPLFDQNQAQKAKADHLRRQAARLVEEARGRAAEEALRALEEAGLARATAEALETGVLPPAARAAKWAGTYAGAMQLSELTALEASLELLRERLRHNQALLAEQQALVRLEFALGGPIPGA